MKEHIIAKPYGWLIVYNSRAFAQSRDIMDALISNTPFIFTKTGAIHVLNAAASRDEAIRMIEEEHGLTGS